MFKRFGIAIVAVLIIVVLTLSSQLFETNNSGYLQVKQSAMSGAMSVRIEPGVYPQMFGTITQYKMSDVYDFNREDSKISVRFNDASTATISGQIKYRLPITQEAILKIHRDFRSYDAVHNDLVRQVVAAALKQSATYFRAEDVYSTKRSDFIDLVNDQIKDGIYATSYKEEVIKDEEGNPRLIKTVEMRRGTDGKAIVNEQSAFEIYAIDLIQLVINDIDFDEQTDILIAKRKESEQKRVVARTEAETAKQNTITAQENGKANVAIAEAEALVEKKRAVVQAEKEKEIAAQKALQAEEEKKAIIAKGEADAQAAKLKVAAGLSPLERATIDKETAIGVAAELAKVKLPQLMIMGSNNGAQVDPFVAVGLESLMRINKSLSEAQNGSKAN